MRWAAKIGRSACCNWTAWTPRYGIADFMYACMAGAFDGSAAARSASRTARTSRVLAATLLDPDFWFDRHSRPKAVEPALILVEADAHRKPLHYLHVIAARVFRWQQAGHGSRGRRKTFHVPGKLLPVRIHGNRHLLPGMNAPQLRLLEIRGHPKVIGLRDQKQ